MRYLPAIGVALACGCDYRAFSTQVGEHVVYHWDVATWEAEDERLCGGTAAGADRVVAAISAHYGWTLPEDGPTIEYFWDRELARSSCSWSGSPACAAPDGSILFTDHPFDTHELAHTVRGGHGKPPFIAEGLASRWTSGTVDLGPVFPTSANFFSEEQLRAQLELGPFGVDEVDYHRAMTWLVGLETAYGPAKVREFIDKLSWLSSPDDVERALQQVFGISLAESVALAESVPEGVVDDPVCEIANLPTWVLTDTPNNPSDAVYVDRGEAHCDDDDLISIFGQRAIWLFALEVPEPVDFFDVRVTMPAGVEPDRQRLSLSECNGNVDPGWMSFIIYGVGVTPGGIMHGRHVGALIGEVEPDGTVELPRVSFEERHKYDD